MKKLILTAIVITFSSNAMATMTVTLTDSYGRTSGGEFLLKPTGDPWPFIPASLGEFNSQFESFCLEKREYINFSSTFYAVINTGAEYGGPGSGGFDPLDPMTAYLYDKFISGTLANYSYDTTGSTKARIHSANALQHVIWYIEKEERKRWADGNGSLMDKFYQDALNNHTGGIGLVRVLNLYSDEYHTMNRQDQLVMMIPVPGSILLASIGLCLTGWLRRRGTL